MAVWGNKYDRIRFLMTQDLNTPLCKLVKSVADIELALGHLPGDKASLRTYSLGNETKSKTPFHPNRPKGEIQELATKYLKDGRFELMVSEGVPEEDSVISAISIVGISTIYTEYALGPGTVRRLSMGEVKPLICNWDKKSHCMVANMGCDLFSKFEKVMRRLSLLRCNDILVEWTWSAKPVGWKKQNWIFWEFMNNSKSSYFEGVPWK